MKTRKQISIMIADDHPLMVEGVQSVLSNFNHFEISGTYNTGKHLLAALREMQPDVILLDLQIPDIQGDELAKIIKQEYPNIRIIVLTSNENPYSIKMMLNLGVDGYIFKNSITDTLQQAIECVTSNKSVPFLPEEVQATLKKAGKKDDRNTLGPESLTPRELEIIQLISAELTSQEIGEKLHIHYRTVEIYRLGIMRKLGAKNMVGMVKKAIMLGLIKE